MTLEKLKALTRQPYNDFMFDVQQLKLGPLKKKITHNYRIRLETALSSIWRVENARITTD